MKPGTILRKQQDLLSNQEDFLLALTTHSFHEPPFLEKTDQIIKPESF